MARAETPQVFISYARDSGQKQARALHRRLRRNGVPAFLDTHSLDHGDSIPGGVFDSLLGAKVLVAFADPTYFTRRYCVAELETALAAYRSLVESGGRMARLAEALLPIVIALSPEGQRAAELDLLPLGLRDTKWPLAGETSALSALVRERLDQIETTFGERLHGLGALEHVQDRIHEAMTIPAPRSLAAVPLYHETGLPKSIGDAFVGRGRELWELHTALASRLSQAAAVTTVLEGGAGFGKTRLALEYLHRYGAEAYPGGVFWLNADVSPDRLESQLHGILRALRPETPDLRAFDEGDRDLHRELGAALQERAASGPVLYVVDNVPEPDGEQPPDSLGRYCPGHPHVSLLATSRATLTVLAGLRSLEIRELSDESAVRMLTAGVRGRRTIPNEAWLDIANWVGGLPLALELLNAMLTTGAMSPTDLSRAQREGRPTEQVDRGMDALRTMVPSGTLRGVTEALEISYRRLPDDARLAAHVVAWLSPDPIPSGLLADEALFSPRVRGLLRTRSFVTEVRSADVELFGRMHRVLADYLRGVSGDRAAELRRARAALIHVMTPDAAVSPAQWPLLDACRPHAEAVLHHGLAVTPEDPGGGGSVQLATQTVSVLAARGRINAAAGWAQRCSEAVRGALGAEHPIALVMRLGHAQTLRFQGQLPQAREHLEELAEAMARMLGDEHEVTLQTRASLAATLLDQGELARGRALLEELLPLCIRVLSEDHQITVTVKTFLARALYDAGELTRAQLLVDQAVKALRTQGADEQLTLLGLAALRGSTLLRQSDPAQAGALLEQVLSTSRQVLGHEHPLTLMVMNDLALSLDQRGEVTGARELIEEAVESSRQVFDPEHPAVLSMRGNLAMLLGSEGEWTGGLGEEGEPLAQMVRKQQELLAMHRRLLGDRHPTTLATMGNLGDLLTSQGDLPAARDLLEGAARTGREVLGDEHPDALALTGGLARVLHRQGETTRAAGLREQVLEALQRELGPEHPATLAAMAGLAASLGARGRGKQARALLEQACDGSRRVLGDQHPRTIIRTMELCTLMMTQGDFPRAAELYGRVLETSQSLLGPDHPMRVLLMTGRANALRLQGDTAQADELAAHVREMAATTNTGVHPALMLARGLTDGLSPEDLQRALDLTRKSLGDDHVLTMEVTGLLGTALAARGQHDRAVELLEPALKGLRRTLGRRHLMTLQTTLLLGMALYAQGNAAQALPLLEEVRRIGQRALGRAHPLLLAATLALGMVLHADGQTARGIELLEGGWRATRKALGEDDERTLAVEAGLARLLGCQGKTDRAAEMYEHVIATSQDAALKSKVAGELAGLTPGS